MFSVNRLAVLGDSLSQLTVLSPSIAQGGKGGWFELDAEMFGAISNFGPLVSSGKRGCWLGSNGGSFVGDGEVTTAGAWTDVVSTDAFYKAPYGVNAAPAAVAQRSAAGTSATKSWTNPSRWRAAVGYAITFVDYSGGGDWSFRDPQTSGSFVSNGQTLHNDNRLTEFYVAHAVAPGQSVDIQAATAAGVAAGCLPLFVEWFWIDPTLSTTRGIIFDNFAVSGSRLHDLCAATSGDPLACLDSITAGTGWGSASISRTPNLGVLCGHINDFALGSSTNWGTDLSTLQARVAPLGPLALWNPWEANTGTFPQADQTAYRAQTKSSAAAFSPPSKVLDLYDVYATLGYTGNAALVAAGLVSSDHTHALQALHLDMAPRFFWFLRNDLFTATIGGNVNAFTFGKSAFGGTDGFGGRPALIVTGTATLAGGGTLAGAGTRKVAGTAAFAGGGALAATGRRVVLGSASFQGGGTFAATGRRSVVGTATLAAGGTFAASGTRGVLGTAALAGGGVLAATGSRTVHGAAALAGGGIFTGVGEDIQLGSALLDGGGVLAAAGVRAVVGAALLRGSSDQDEEAILWPEGDELGWPEGDPILWAEGVHVFTAEGVRVVVGAALLDGGGVFSAVAAGIATGTGVLDGGGTLTAAGTRVVLGAAAMQCGGTFAATGTRKVLGSATLAGGGTFTAVGAEIETGVATLVGGGVLAASGTRVVVGQASFAGGGLFAATGVRTVHGSGQLNGGGVFSAAAAGITTGTATMLGGGTFTAVGHARYTGTASLNGGGVFTATGTRRVVASASLAGGGSFVASGIRVVHGTASLLGGGQFYATAGAIVSGVAFFDGGGVFHARAIPPMVTFSVRAARDGWQFTASADGWHARPARDGWKVEAR